MDAIIDLRDLPEPQARAIAVEAVALPGWAGHVRGRLTRDELCGDDE